MSKPEVIVDELNRLYEFEPDKYVNECNTLKKIGYRIFRNPDGKHQIIEPARPNDIYNMFGGIFGDIFK